MKLRIEAVPVNLVRDDPSEPYRSEVEIDAETTLGLSVEGYVPIDHTTAQCHLVTVSMAKEDDVPGD